MQRYNLWARKDWSECWIEEEFDPKAGEWVRYEEVKPLIDAMDSLLQSHDRQMFPTAEAWQEARAALAAAKN